MIQKTTVGILGLGRFGQLLVKLLAKDFDVYGFDIKRPQALPQVTLVDLATLLKMKTIFISVPIRYFETTLINIAPNIAPDSTVIDVCSVKVEPVASMLKYLPMTVGIIATHPLFGPDSINENGPHTLMMHDVRDAQQCYAQWKAYFGQQFTIAEMTPDEHDSQAALSQGITHLIGRILNEMQLQATDIDTLGFKKLLAVAEQTCHDSLDLFVDLHSMNPYSRVMLEKFNTAQKKIISLIE